ncbi:hypothetical protein PtA15_2A817 [Puccinia triticina]|nr:uncharacterized protein PtA15_2A817 [Puccinia triticina]WAQ82500.1 hypothetical protein PtA15_2A817 [Puccinia triticina]
MATLLASRHQLRLPAEALRFRSPITSQFNRLTWDVKPSLRYTTNSSKQEDGGKDVPIGLAEALRDRYVIPIKTIYAKLAAKKNSVNQTAARMKNENDVDDEPEGEARRSALEEPSKQPLPNSITEAWKIGLQGTDPRRFSRLRSRAAIPLVSPQPQERSPLTSAEPPPAELLSPSSPELGDGDKPGAQSAKKKSLLESYLALDKRSQRIISFSVFIWSLSGVIYFTWFSPFQQAPPSPAISTRTAKIFKSSAAAAPSSPNNLDDSKALPP